MCILNLLLFNIHNIMCAAYLYVIFSKKLKQRNFNFENLYNFVNG